MSGTPELDDAVYAARAKTLFGAEPKVTCLTTEEGDELLEAINPQRKVSTREETVEQLPAPTEPAETLEMIATLVVGNALINDIRGDAAVKKIVGEGLRQQVLGGDQDGGELFQQLAPGGKAPMLKVNKEGAIGKKTCSAHEAVVIAVDSPYGAQALCEGLEELQKRSGTEGDVRAFTWHDLRLEAQIKATKEAEKVPHAWLKRDVADQKAALKAFAAAAAEQDGTTIAIRRQAAGAQWYQRLRQERAARRRHRRVGVVRARPALQAPWPPVRAEGGRLRAQGLLRRAPLFALCGQPDRQRQGAHR